MATHLFTNQERLRLLELLIERLRKDGQTYDPFNVYVALLGTLCKEIRAEAPGHAEATISALEEKIELTLRSRTPLGYDLNRLSAMGLEFMGRWPVIKKALQGMKEQA